VRAVIHKCNLASATSGTYPLLHEPWRRSGQGAAEGPHHCQYPTTCCTAADRGFVPIAEMEVLAGTKPFWCLEHSRPPGLLRALWM